MRLISSKPFSAAIILTVGHVGSQVLSFARNVLLARYLTKADYGLAAAFALSMSMLELAGRMALGRQVVQARDGGDLLFQRNAQAFQLAAGLVGAVLLFFAAGVLSNVLKVPDQTWAFRLLALVPLSMALEHLDSYRFQRELRFVPRVLCEVGPQLVVTLSVWPLLVWLGDFRVVLWVIIGKACIGVMMTHLLAERRYELSWDRAIAARIVAFSWPLVVNGFFIFLSQQADQFVVGSQFSMDELGRYALPVSVVLIPISLFARVVSPIAMSMLAGVQENVEKFTSGCRQVLEMSAVVTIVCMLPLIVSGEQVIVALFGEKFVGTGNLMALMATASALRFLRITPTTGALALGDAKNLMWANIARGCGLLLVFFVVYLGLAIEWVAACAVVGELFALFVSFGLMSSRHSFPMLLLLKPLTYLLGGLSLGWGVLRLGGASEWGLVHSGGASCILSVSAVLIGWFCFPYLRKQLLNQ